MLFSLALVICFSLIALLAVRRLTRGSQCDVNRIELFLSGEVIADHYRPLEKLLQKTDWQYLSRQPGMTPAKVRRFRAERRRIFRQYLSHLISDFGALCFLVKALMVQSAVDRSDLAQTLSRTRKAFYWAVATTHLSLLAHAVGLTPVNIEVGSLTRALESLSAQTRMLQLSSAPSLA
jgi:hypothetical protein